MSGKRARRLAALLSAVLVTGLAGEATAGIEPSQARPSALIGTWRLSGAGIEPGAVLRLDDRRLAVQEGGCIGAGGWSARPTGELLVHLNGTCAGAGCAHAP